MEANELMIGDYVNLSPGNAVVKNNFVCIYAIKYDNVISKNYVFDIVFLSDGVVQYNYNPRCLKPIPLTPEILEKNGFKKEKLTTVTIWRNGDFSMEFDAMSNRFYYCEVVMDFVHQFQHLIRLCGIEKEIIL